MSFDEIPKELVEQMEHEFLDETESMLADCEEAFLNLEATETRAAELTKIFRVAHSIKGGAGVLGLTALADFAHQVEDLLSGLRASPESLTEEAVSLLLRSCDEFRKFLSLFRKKTHLEWDASDLKKNLAGFAAGVASEVGLPRGEVSEQQAGKAESCGESSGESNAVESSTIRIRGARLEAVLNLVGELVVLKSQMLDVFGRLSGENSKETSLLGLFDVTIRDLQERTLSMRMTAVKPVFVRAQRVARDLSVRLGKPLAVTVSGGELEVDRTQIDLLADPLLHIVRNALDHGIETAEERKSAGKPASAALRVSARHQGSHIVVEVEDDGRGVDRAKVLGRAIERGLLTSEQAPKLNDDEVHALLFMPGFSTAERVTDISGRGVGLDVVKSHVEKLKGKLEVRSVPGAGTRFTITFPLTTAITDGLVVSWFGRKFICPMERVLETLDARGLVVIRLDERRRAIQTRSGLIPFVDLCEVLDADRRHEDGLNSGTLLVLNGAEGRYGIAVDEVLGQSQVVVKPLGSAFSHQGAISGVAILGDGKVGLVLDPDVLARSHPRRNSVSGRGLEAGVA